MQLQAKTGEWKKKIKEKLALEKFDEIEDKVQKKKISPCHYWYPASFYSTLASHLLSM